MVYQGPALETPLPPAVAGPAFLRDGTEVWVRPVQASDGELVRDFLEQETAESLEMRFFSAIRPFLAQEEIVRPSLPDDRLCLVVLGDRTDQVSVLGVGEYVRLAAGSAVAEVAFLVAGPFRGRGIATLLLARLARAARAFGIVRFEARVRSENPEMLEVFRGSGLPFHEESAEGEVDVLIPLGPEPNGTGAAGATTGGSVGSMGTATPRRPAGSSRLSALRSRT
jgi:GNAT superfamily N-acetyltransferase